MFTEVQTAALTAKLSPDHVKTRKMAGRTISYIEGWQAIAEANRIFGHDGWARETVRLEETNRDLVTINGVQGEYQQWRVGFLAVVKVVVFAGDTMVTRHGTGFGSGMGKPEALSEAIESAAKEAETDAMKRALMTFGNPFGLALYDKRQENVGVERVVSTQGDRFMPNAAQRKSSAAAKRDGDWEKMLHDMDDARSAISMQRLWDDYRQNEYGKWNPDWQREADELFAHRIAQFSTGDALKETLEDSVSDTVPPTKAQVELFRERAKWLKGATTPEELYARAKNPEHLAEMAKLTEGQVQNLRELYSETLASLTAQMMAAG